MKNIESLISDDNDLEKKIHKNLIPQSGYVLAKLRIAVGFLLLSGLLTLVFDAV
ncbi:MAG: hypothetical protein ABIP95_01175 [Pelobium sp.]